MKFKKKLLSLFIFFFATHSNAIDLQGFKFTDSYRYSFLDDSGFENFKGNFVLDTSYAHIAIPLYVTDSQFNTYLEEVIKSFDLVTLGFSYKFTKDFSLSLDSSFLKTKLNNQTLNRFGDTHLKAKFNFFKKNKNSFAFLPELTIPSGNLESFTTKEKVSGSIKLSYENHFVNSFHFLMNIGFAHSPKNIYTIINYKNLFLTELGLSFDLNDFWNLNLEANRNFTLSSDYRQDEGDYYITLKNKTHDNFSSYFGAGVAGFSSANRKNWTVFLGLKFNFGNNNEGQIERVAEFKKEPEVLKQIEITPQKIIPPPVIVEKPVIIKSAKEEKNLFGEVFAFENIYFDNAKYNIKEKEMLKIDSLMEKISKHKNQIRHIVIEGYASKVGNSKLNQTLSKNRANQVQTALINSGLNENLLSIVAYGDRALNPDKDLNKNRKVQFRIYLLKN